MTLCEKPHELESRNADITPQFTNTIYKYSNTKYHMQQNTESYNTCKYHMLEYNIPHMD